ncbi:argininosuccinate synthase [Paraburkholderia sp. NMBU_R16]|uniref:argininosuccinate synthase n=1 Tax=Paraburkholderia sp. NMBU_R16 TaxID=2698676 RepID=UPI0015650C18|nr:argininosuccinate synthase [Paraburkholderia sp. NMBU_R16]NRO95116.1 argininosuccinate synthase [Paraburkholderia sp. NMBU_R16]
MKIVLAYSGGLDTSVALKWLQLHYGAEVIAYCANLGQPDDFPAIERKALETGAHRAVVDDVRTDYLERFVYPALRAGALYEGRYPMAAPLGRPLIVERLVELAQREGADAIAHGATGKGNDQVRFYSGVAALDPRLKVIAPAIEWELKSRDDEIAFAHAHRIPVQASAARPYSMDGTLWGTSTECGAIDDFRYEAPADAYQITQDPLHAPARPDELTIGFTEGRPTSLDGTPLAPLALVSRVAELGAKHGVGRIDMVENSLLGIKSRAIYESPAGTILHLAHAELEDLTLDRETQHYKAALAMKYAELVYYGQWFSPLREALDAFVSSTQRSVSGAIRLRLHKGSVCVIERQPEAALYDYGLTAHDGADRFDHPSGQGFAYVWSMPMRIRARVLAGDARPYPPPADRHR